MSSRLYNVGGCGEISSTSFRGRVAKAIRMDVENVARGQDVRSDRNPVKINFTRRVTL